MLGVIYNFEIGRGEALEWEVDLQNPDGSAMDLTGCTVAGVIFPPSGAQPHVPIAGVVDNPLTGRVKFVVDGAGSALLTGTYYRHNILITDSLGKRKPLIIGQVDVTLIIPPA